MTIEDTIKNTFLGNSLKLYWSGENFRMCISHLGKRVLKRDNYIPRFHKILDLRIEYGRAVVFNSDELFGEYDYEIFNILLKVEGIDYYLSLNY
jgi:hypothetical protein